MPELFDVGLSKHKNWQTDLTIYIDRAQESAHYHLRLARITVNIA
jgi:hypothetical protein